MSEPGAAEAYHAARLAYELGSTVRALREQRGWSQTQLAAAAGMTQSAVARFEAGGTVPSLRVLDRLAQALDAELTVQVTPRTHVA
ncbi:MAG TPA: helix-turn-helix transcriptional regulator [Propionibacteriaceae bacterium]